MPKDEADGRPISVKDPNVKKLRIKYVNPLENADFHLLMPSSSLSRGARAHKSHKDPTDPQDVISIQVLDEYDQYIRSRHVHEDGTSK